ncbi:hypothetical protein SCLCIDRAFT_1213846 [Scleroderma citrinum Foug A]|uniref:Uncharacterized protein n=1 Tax=Scleroderma citrinum Foug A TaxID=1036808 RepID=A0A0C2ZR29_9AGAM|nr:hypothetical protein SCLCIDRAFT_1213846 [Scleroderma citrinum Foug A]
MDIPRPLVRFSFSNPTQDDHVTSACHGVGETISALHGALHELCSLEWINVPLEGVVLSGTLDESLRLEMPEVYPGFIDDISEGLVAGRIQHNAETSCEGLDDTSRVVINLTKRV